MKNNTQTTVVHGVIAAKLVQARETLAKLKDQQRLIDLQIEDHARIILALERTEATLSVALDPPVAPTPEKTDAVDEAVTIALGSEDPERVMSLALEREFREDKKEAAE